jgi:hypothetical protein
MYLVSPFGATAATERAARGPPLCDLERTSSRVSQEAEGEQSNRKLNCSPLKCTTRTVQDRSEEPA